LDIVFNRFHVPTKVFTNQGMLWGVIRIMWKNINWSSHDFMKPFQNKYGSWVDGANGKVKFA
jgi:hypothetical protein